MQFLSASARHTQAFAEQFARELRSTPPLYSHACVIALEGNLGTGKTTFTQGFAKGFGIRERVLSPTFIVFRVHSLSKKTSEQYRRLIHMDAYRLRSAKELKPLGFKELCTDPSNLILVEWPQRIRRALPPRTIWIRLSLTKKETERRIQISLRS